MTEKKLLLYKNVVCSTCDIWSIQTELMWDRDQYYANSAIHKAANLTVPGRSMI